MTDRPRTMERTLVVIDDGEHELSQGQDIGALQAEIEEAVHVGGQFVRFGVVGNRRVAALITPASRVVFTVVTVLYDERDVGDSGGPYGGFYDDFDLL